MLTVSPKIRPILDPDFVPAVLWNREYQKLVAADRKSQTIHIAVSRLDGTRFIWTLKVLPHTGKNVALNQLYVERLVKFYLWMKGGCTITVYGHPKLAAWLGRVYSKTGLRKFDWDFVGRRMFGQQIQVVAGRGKPPKVKETTIPLGRHLDGCRIGFDLGGSDRKAAALINGKVVYSEEIKWNPYFEKDPWYHLSGINDTLQRAAAHLPRIDAIGGSAAGVYVNNEPRAASLFRGISDADFATHIRRLFFVLKEWWGGVPFEVVNDGEVTALAGSMSLKANSVLGVSMGTSVAAGYVTPTGNITPWLNELAFVPVDYRKNAPADEWSGDLGCAVQYFCQQGVNRLLGPAGIELPKEMSFADKLVEVQKLMAAGDPRARKIYETIGVCFGYTIAHFADFYDFTSLLILGRVTSGEGGEIIIAKAQEVLKAEFPALAKSVKLRTPSEKDKRHGQAIAAASLPALRK